MPRDGVIGVSDNFCDIAILGNTVDTLEDIGSDGAPEGADK
jgi:hypothetical protein